MQVFTSLVPSNEPTAVALGFFDGIHAGHRAVLGGAVRCKSEGLVPAAFTFSSTPKPLDKNRQLTTNEEKADMLGEMGIERLYLVDFNAVRDYSPKKFVDEIIRGTLNARKVFCGFNYRFGKHGLGDTEMLTLFCAEHGIEVEVIPAVEIDGDVDSSSRIRALLKNGQVEEASRLLGYDFGLKAKSVHGNHIGSMMGTPTINLRFGANVILPRFGVYASIVTIDGKEYVGVTNIGVRPTVGEGNEPNCETWLPRYHGGDLYGKTVDVRLKKFIRPEVKFGSLEELKAAIHRDGEIALGMYGKKRA